MCPYYLDGDRGIARGDSVGRNRDFFKVIALRRSPNTRVIGYCAVFKVREEASTATRMARDTVQRATGSSRSLKTQQHARRTAGRQAA